MNYQSSFQAFLDNYNVFERLVTTRYGSITEMLKHEPYSKLTHEIRCIQNTRNALVHNSKLRERFLLEITPEALTFLNDIIHSLTIRAGDVMIRTRDIYKQSIDGNICEAMKVMRDKSYTHVPIIRSGRVIGAFSENTLLSYILDHGSFTLNNNARFQEIKEYLSFANHYGETFKFTKQSETAINIKDMFEKATKKQDRIGMVFVTSNGEESGNLLGIITAWDIVQPTLI